MNRNSFSGGIIAPAILLLLTSFGVRAEDPPPMMGDTVYLESIQVGPTFDLKKLAYVADIQSKFNALPSSVRDTVGLKFYLVEPKGRKIITGPALDKIHLSIEDGAAPLAPLSVSKFGQVDLPEQNDAHSRAKIVANVTKDQIELGYRLYIKLPANGALTLGYLHTASDAYLEAYKPYAGTLFRMFVKDKKPNCFGVNFLSPQKVTVHAPGDSTTVWQSPKDDTRVVTFYEDLPTQDSNAVVDWAGGEPPFHIAACLQDKSKVH